MRTKLIAKKALPRGNRMDSSPLSSLGPVPVAPPGSTVLGIPADKFNAMFAEAAENKKLKVKRHSDTAVLPERKSALAAGYDLCSDEELTIPPGQRRAIETNISVEVPAGHYGRVAPRSGLAVKQGINVMAGVIDADYRGKVGVVLINHSYDSFRVKVGDRIAQLILEKCSMFPVEEITEHTVTARGEGGFGSTGLKSKQSSPREQPTDAPASMPEVD